MNIPAGAKKAMCFILGNLFVNLANVFYSEIQNTTTKSHVSFSQKIRPPLLMFSGNLLFLLYSIVKINEMYDSLNRSKITIRNEANKINQVLFYQNRSHGIVFPQNPNEVYLIQTNADAMQCPLKWPMYLSYAASTILFLTDQILNVSKAYKDSSYLSLVGVVMFSTCHVYYAYQVRSNLNQLNQNIQRLVEMKDFVCGINLN